MTNDIKGKPDLSDVRVWEVSDPLALKRITELKTELTALSKEKIAIDQKHEARCYKLGVAGILLNAALPIPVVLGVIGASWLVTNLIKRKEDKAFHAKAAPVREEMKYISRTGKPMPGGTK